MNKIFFIFALLFSGIVNAQWVYNEHVREFYTTGSVVPITPAPFPQDSFEVWEVHCSANEQDARNLDVWDKRIPSRIGKATIPTPDYYREYGFDDSIAIYYLCVFASGKNYAMKVATNAFMVEFEY